MSLNNLSFCLSSTYYYNLKFTSESENLQVKLEIYKWDYLFVESVPPEGTWHKKIQFLFESIHFVLQDGTPI